MKPNLGFGLGLRPAHYRYILEHRPAVDWFEIVSENYLGIGGRPRAFLDQVRAHYPIVMHGVGLSIASTEPLNRRYLTKLKELADRIQPRLVTDHLCWTNHRGANSHDLLPVAYTEEVLAHVARRVEEVQSFLGRKLYLENPSAYVAFATSEMSEAEFLAELCRRAGSGILLDVNNLYVNQQNLGIDPAAYLDHLKEEWLAYFHLAGHTVTPEIRIDTHDAVVPEGVLKLYEETARRFPRTGTMVEWDGDVPEFPVVHAELEKAQAAHARAAQSSSPTPSPQRARGRRAQDAAVTWRDTQEVFWRMATGQKSVEADDAALITFERDLPAKAHVGINVYADAYLLRICEAVRETYPSLTYVLGAGILNQVVRDYLVVHPSTEVSIKYAGQHLAAYLREAPLPTACRAPNAVLADVAALEWARGDVFDREDGPAPLAPAVLAEVSEDQWPRVRFEFSRALELVETSHAVHTVLAAVATDEAPDLPKAERTRYLVYREEGEVHHRVLDASEHALLSALRAGASFLPACEAAARAGGRSLESEVPEAVTRLGDWLALGLITGLSV